MVEVIVMVGLGLYLSMIGYKMHRLSLSILSGIITWFLVKYFTYDMGNISTSICILSGVGVFIFSYLLKKINFMKIYSLELVELGCGKKNIYKIL